MAAKPSALMIVGENKHGFLEARDKPSYRVGSLAEAQQHFMRATGFTIEGAEEPGETAPADNVVELAEEKKERLRQKLSQMRARRGMNS